MATGLSANQFCQSERLQGREHWTVFCEATSHQTIVSRRREEVRDDRREQEDRARDKTRSAADKFPSFPMVRNLSQRQISGALANRTCGTHPMTKLNMKQ